MNEQQLANYIQSLGLNCDEQMAERFYRYADLLKEWNEKMNLTAIVEKEEVYEKHFADSLSLLRFTEVHGSICDVGTGAGFPGLVLAIANPELSVTLLEPLHKRCVFLQEVINQLSLTNVCVVNGRAEDYVEGREFFDVTTARAVADLSILSELCIPLTKVGGHFIAMKGPSGQEELQRADHAIKVLGGKTLSAEKEELSYGTRVQIVIQKVKNTPKGYPRPYARIKKKPL